MRPFFSVASALETFCNVQGKQQRACTSSSPANHADRFHCSPWTPSPSSCVWCVALSLYQRSGPGPHRVCLSHTQERKCVTAIQLAMSKKKKQQVNSGDEDDWPIHRFSTTSSPSGISSLHNEVSLRGRQTLKTSELISNLVCDYIALYRRVEIRFN